MMRKLLKRQRGFTLIELLIVVAIIGIIAALLIPNFLESLQKAKQKRTMADMRNMGTAKMAWLTDQAGAAAAGLDTTSWVSGAGWAANVAEVEAALVPRYVQELPLLDGWKHGFGYSLRTGRPLELQVMAVWSGGRDATQTTAVAPVPSVTGMPDGAYDPVLYDNDIFWADGTFLSWPEKTTVPQTGP